MELEELIVIAAAPIYAEFLRHYAEQGEPMPPTPEWVHEAMQNSALSALALYNITRQTLDEWRAGKLAP